MVHVKLSVKKEERRRNNRLLGSTSTSTYKPKKNKTNVISLSSDMEDIRKNDIVEPDIIEEEDIVRETLDE
ncbi:unnamed protein product, partial [Citrullus colocynthis]